MIGPKPLTNAERRRRRVAKLKQEGGRVLHVEISAEAVAALDQMMGEGRTLVDVVNDALTRAVAIPAA